MKINIQYNRDSEFLQLNRSHRFSDLTENKRSVWNRILLLNTQSWYCNTEEKKKQHLFESEYCHEYFEDVSLHCTYTVSGIPKQCRYFLVFPLMQSLLSHTVNKYFFGKLDYCHDLQKCLCSAHCLIIVWTGWQYFFCLWEEKYTEQL